MVFTVIKRKSKQIKDIVNACCSILPCYHNLKWLIPHQPQTKEGTHEIKGWNRAIDCNSKASINLLTLSLWLVNFPDTEIKVWFHFILYYSSLLIYSILLQISCTIHSCLSTCFKSNYGAIKEGSATVQWPDRKLTH